MTIATDIRPATIRGRKPKTQPTAPQFTLQMHRAAQAVDARMLEALAEIQMTPRQYALLRAAAAELDQSQNSLVARTGIDRSTLADLVRRMIKRGWLARTRSKVDLREWHVRLTDDGIEVFAQAKEIAANVDREIANRVATAVSAAALSSALEEIIIVEAT